MGGGDGTALGQRRNEAVYLFVDGPEGPVGLRVPGGGLRPLGPQPLLQLGGHLPLQGGQVHPDGGPAHLQIRPAAAQQVALAPLPVDLHRVAAGPAFQKAGEPGVLPTALAAQLLVALQLVLTGEPELGGDQALVEAQGEAGAVSRPGAVPLAHQQSPVAAVEAFGGMGEGDATGLVIAIDLHVGPDVDGVVENAGEGYIVPHRPPGAGDTGGVESADHAAQGGLRRGVGSEQGRRLPGLFSGQKGGEEVPLRSGVLAEPKPVGRGAAGPGPQPGALVVVVLHPLGGGLPLQLGKDHDNVQHGPAHGSGGVEGLVDGDELHPAAAQGLPQPPEVGDGPGEAVQAVHHDLADEPPLHVGHEPPEGGAVGVLAGVAPVLVDFDVLAGLPAAQVDLALDGEAVRLVHRLPGIDGVQAASTPFPSSLCGGSRALEANETARRGRKQAPSGRYFRYSTLSH